jgi:hypothetical protein
MCYVYCFCGFLGTAEATIASSAIALDACLLATSTYLEKCN